MITDLVLAENSLSGEIPKELGNLDKLEILILQINGLSGSIPREIFNMSTLKTLSLVVNNLSGTLPTFLGHWLPNLEYLNLGANYIGGVIPAQMSNASNLVNLDLSNNQFAGFIPNSLENLAKLKTLRLLTGEIPSGGPFANFTYESFLSNSEGLCGSHRLHVPPCPANTLHQSKKNRVVVIVLVSLAVLVVLIASVSVLPIFKRQNREIPTVLVEDDENLDGIVAKMAVTERGGGDGGEWRTRMLAELFPATAATIFSPVTSFFFFILPNWTAWGAVTESERDGTMVVAAKQLPFGR
nr:probable LRR receptor-like serine/threonine-protein kinase At3g47570 [Ipomoea batatas]